MATAAASAWIDAVGQLGGAHASAVEAAAELDDRYAQPHRHYHGGAHVDAVVRDCAWLAGELGLSVEDRAVVLLAACAHDVVYDGRPGADERASAAWAVERLSATGVAALVARRVEQLVLATITHAAGPDDRLAAVLLDADLAILAAPPDDYTQYVAAVRREYAHVSEADWRVGRARVLADLLTHDPLYVTAPARARWESAARRNVQAEVLALSG